MSAHVIGERLGRALGALVMLLTKVVSGRPGTLSMSSLAHKTNRTCDSFMCCLMKRRLAAYDRTKTSVSGIDINTQC